MLKIAQALRNYWQTPNKIMKNQSENKKRNKFDSYTFIHFIADLIEPLYIFCSYIHKYIYIYIYIYVIYIYYIYIYMLYIYIYYIYIYIYIVCLNFSRVLNWKNDGLRENYGMRLRISCLCNHQAYFVYWSQVSDCLLVRLFTYAWWLHKHETLSPIL